jgi:hypothetical protein
VIGFVARRLQCAAHSCNTGQQHQNLNAANRATLIFSKLRVCLLMHYTAERVRTYGYNLVSIKVDSLARILGREITTPFFFFQLFSTITWLAGKLLDKELSINPFFAIYAMP